MDEEFDVILLGTGLTGKNTHSLYGSTVYVIRQVARGLASWLVGMGCHRQGGATMSGL